MQADPETLFTPEQAPGETLLWSGQPQQGFLLRRSDLIWVPISLAAGGLSVAVEGWLVWTLWQVLQLGDHSSMGLFILVGLGVLALVGLVLVLLAAFLVLGRFWFDSLRRQKTFYALTDRRVMICSTIIKKRIRSVALDPKIKVILAPHANRSGSIYLNSDVYAWWLLMGPPWWLPLWPDVEAYQPPFVERIAQAEEVYKQIKQLTRAA